MTRNDFSQLLNNIEVSGDASHEDVIKLVLPISNAVCKMMPEQLFRYRRCTDLNIDAFEHDKIYAVTADKFNDPYDTLTMFNVDNMRRFVDELMTKESFLHLQQRLKDRIGTPNIIKESYSEEKIKEVESVFLAIKDDKLDDFVYKQKNDFIHVIELLYPILAELNKRYSTIACFSETINSVTMWSHYADYHKGFALEYNFRPTLSNGIPNIGIFPVIYEEERYDATIYISWCFLKTLGLNISELDKLAHIKYALHKSAQWEYEQEWRLIDSTTRNNVLMDDNTVITFAPKAIYYGRNIDINHKSRLHKIAVSKNLKEYDMYIDHSSPKYEMLYRQSSSGD